MLLLAVPITAAGAAAALGPGRGSGSLAGDLLIGLAVAAGWWLAALLAIGPWRRRRAYRSGGAALEVDESGLTLPGFTGRLVYLPWDRVEAMILARDEGRHVVRLRARGLSGSFRLDDLDVPPDAAWETIVRSRGSS